VVDWSNNLVAVQYPNGPIANDADERDCFWFVRENLEVNAPINETFTLHRPLAQLNFGVTAEDTADAEAAGLVVSQSKIVASTYTQFNVLTGKCTGELVDYTFAQNNVPSQKLTVSNVDYTYIGTAYLLVNDGEPLKDNISITIYDDDANKTEINTLSYDNVPFKRNYRTNILGALLTNPAEFTVKVDERFDGDLTPGSNNTPIILPAQDVVEFGAEGGDTSVALTLTNITENVTCTPSDYIVIDEAYVDNGVLHITVNKNTSSEPRTATITLAANGAEATITVKQEGKAVTSTVTTVAEFLAAEEDDTKEYTLRGTITAVDNTTYGNFYLTDETGTVLIYGLCSPEGAQKYWAASGAKIGDDIVVKTIRSSYNNTPQGKNAKFVELVSPGTRAFWSFDKEALGFSSAAAEKTIKVDAYNLKNEVNVVSDNSQFSATYASGILTVSALENTSTDAISGNITVTCGTLNQVITIKQSGVVVGGVETSVERTMASFGWTNAATVKEAKLDDNVTVTFAQGKAGTAPAYYTSGNAVRLYQNGATMTINAGGHTIKSIELTFASNHYYIAPDCGEFSAEGATRTWTGNAAEVKFTTTGTDKNHRAYVSKIKVVYE
jgi:hypothetical protein